MTCSICQIAVRPEARQCPRCGAPLSGAVAATWHADVGQRPDDLGLAAAVVTPQPVADPTTVRPAPVRMSPPEDIRPSAPEPAAPSPTYVAPHQRLVAFQGGAPLDLHPRASAGARFGASLLDGLILTLGYFVFAILFSFLTAGIGGTLGNGYFGGLSRILGVFIFGAIIAYPIIGNAVGQTLGKRLMKIMVVDRTAGVPIGMGRSTVRYLMMIVMGLPCYLGYLSILSRDGRGWHDRVADSIVIRVQQ